MEKICNKFLTGIHFLVALILVLMALLTMGWAVYEIVTSLLSDNKQGFIPLVLHSVGAIIIAGAIIDVAQYMIEEDVFKNKELRNPEEARKTITKIMVVIAIAVSIEGLVYILKAGTEDLRLLVYPATLIFVSSLSIIALGIYQKLSISVEDKTDTKILTGNKNNQQEH